jgi:hypothetical protein
MTLLAVATACTHTLHAGGVAGVQARGRVARIIPAAPRARTAPTPEATAAGASVSHIQNPMYFDPAVIAQCEEWMKDPMLQIEHKKTLISKDNGTTEVARFYLEDDDVRAAAEENIALLHCLVNKYEVLCCTQPNRADGALDFAICQWQGNVVKALVQYLGPCNVSITNRSVLYRLFLNSRQLLEGRRIFNEAWIARIEKMADAMIFVMQQIIDQGMVEREFTTLTVFLSKDNFMQPARSFMESLAAACKQPCPFSGRLATVQAALLPQIAALHEANKGAGTAGVASDSKHAEED